MSKVKDLETELRLVYDQLYIVSNSSGFHARHNSLLKRYVGILDELERKSIKWKIKKIIRRIKNCGKR